jgi:galactokinase
MRAPNAGTRKSRNAPGLPQVSLREVNEFFQKTFKALPVRTAYAPGRVELLGNHTDYNQGLVMALAVDKHITIAAARRTDGKIELASTAFPTPARFSVSDIAKDPAAPWADYVKGLLLHLRQRGVHFTGFNAAIHSTIPLGAGLSSSAALLVSAALVLRKLFPYALTARGCGQPPVRDARGELPPLTKAEKITLAKICQDAENQFVGVQCGLLDYISSLFGRAHHAMVIDCLHLSIDWTPLIGEVAVVITHSGVKHALADGEYNALRRHCESAARALRVRALRMVDAQDLATGRAQLEARDYQCAYHIVGENLRVTRGEQALRDHDLLQFGQFLYQSHESSRDFFKNSCPELDLLVESARAHPGCLGARLTGGGFGGATLNLVQRDQVEDFRRHLAAHYQQQTGRALESWICQIVDGAA